MKNYAIKLFSTLILSAGLIQSLPANAAINNGVWVNDMAMLFANNQAVILAINIRTFNAQDKNGNDIVEPEKGEVTGNFVNATKRLNELKASGVNTIHILPFTPTGKIKAMGTAGSLYAISDFTKLDPNLDDKNNNLTVEQEAKNFIKECHRRNIRVIVDLPSCGSYDLFLAKPELFAIGADGQPIVPADWTDVRLFKSVNEDGSLNQPLYQQYKLYVDMVQRLGADGIRADVATNKPYEFWKQLISYAKAKDPQFLFLAEASDSWTQPVAKDAPFTPSYKLLEAGFDGWYGSFMNFKDWRTSDKFEKEMNLVTNIIKDFMQKGSKKSVIGSFATHDELSPIITGGVPFSTMIMWLQATLPMNSYFVDGFQSGDAYQYKYANQKAPKTYTDDDIYYVHKGQFDIFNYSRKPGANNDELVQNFKMVNSFKMMAGEIVNRGELCFLDTNNPDVFAYTVNYRHSSILVILNKNFSYSSDATVTVKNFKKGDNIQPFVFTTPPIISKNKIALNMAPGEVSVLLVSRGSHDAKTKQQQANKTPLYR